MSKKAEMLIEIEVDDNGSRKIKALGDNIDTTSKQGKKGFGSMDSSLSGFISTASAALPVVAGIAAGIGVAVVAMSAMVDKAAGAQREIKTLATLTGTSTGDLQAYAYATNKIGISMEQLADISKDVKDKLGDFIATGGGEFADFFEQVGEKVGVTAQSLQGLSGPDVLIAVKKAMDDANVSAEEQVFYLEAIGNDASKLIPLLEREGQALKDQAAEARSLGTALSEIDSNNLLGAAEASSKFKTSFEGLYNRIAARLAPLVTVAMNQVAEAIGGVNEALDESNDPLLNAQENVDRLQRIADTFASKAEATGYWEDWKKVNAQLEKAQQNLRDLQERNGRLALSSSTKSNSLDGSKTNKANTGVDADLAGFYKGFDEYSGSLDSYFTASNKKVVASVKKTGKEYIDAWQHVYADRYDVQSRSLQAQIDSEQDLFKAVDADLEDYFGDLDKLAGKGETTADRMKDAFSGWASGMASDITDVVWGAEASFGSIAESFGKMITQMIVQTQIVEPVMKTLLGSGGSGASGGMLGGLFSMIFNAQGNVFPANTAGISAYSNSIVSSPTVFPFAKGIGLFGEAGAEAIMPLTRTSSGNLGVEAVGGGGGTNVSLVVNNYSGEKETVTTKTMPNGGKQITVAIGMMKTAISSGSLDSTMKQNYGVTRRAY